MACRRCSSITSTRPTIPAGNNQPINHKGHEDHQGNPERAASFVILRVLCGERFLGFLIPLSLCASVVKKLFRLLSKAPPEDPPDSASPVPAATPWSSHPAAWER